FSPDRLHLASGSVDHTIQLWDLRSGVSIIKLEGHSDQVNTIAFSPEGLCLASCSDDQTVQLWDPMSGTSITTLEGHFHPVLELAFSLDGGTLISQSKKETFIWDLTSQPSHCLSPVVTPRLFVDMTQLFWYHQDQWIQVLQDGHARWICYIPPCHQPSTNIVVLIQQTYSQVVVGCDDGHMIILAVPHHLFSQYLSEEPV
ncbi:hypothetical protein BS47DRAFT_1308606, partial [Hydnum rufescens UP504]